MASHWTLDRLQAELDSWSLPDALEDADRHSRPMDKVIGRMWAYHRDLELRAHEYALRKSHYERLKGASVLKARAKGERSADVATMGAIQEDDVFGALVAYRAAEQLRDADKEALRILHATLDKMRTEAADSRAADKFLASNGPG